MLQMASRMAVLGTETAFEVLARANALAAQGRSIINLGIGQSDFPTPDHIVEAGRKALADGHHGYTPANGIAPLRAAVAADLWRRHRQYHRQQKEQKPGDVLGQRAARPQPDREHQQRRGVHGGDSHPLRRRQQENHRRARAHQRGK